MKSIYKSTWILLLVSFSFISCNDFLDRPPLDGMSEPDFFENESHVRIFSYGFYPTFFPGYGTGLAHGPFLLGQTSNDDITTNVQSEFAPIRVPESDGSWGFGTVRRANLMLERVSDMGFLGAEAQNHWLGVSRFFRAAEYSRLTFTYGSVPYMDRVSNINPENPDKAELDYLYKDRDSRVFVVKKIMEDFRFALDNVRKNDGSLQINKYVVAAYVARMMLREGTFLKYHDIDLVTAEECLKMAKEACLIVMDGPFSIANSYNALFTSEDLAGNSEIIFYRKYVEGILMHSTVAYCNMNTEPMVAPTKALLETYLRSDGLPVYYNNPTWKAVTAAEFFDKRDGRLAGTIRSRYLVNGENNSPFAYSISGYSWCKFMDDKLAGSADQKFAKEKNITDAPVLRLGEVLVNYAEICYELGTLTQDDLNKSINKLRDRKGVELPYLEIVGGQPAVKGIVYDDPKRDPTVASLLWEIRRERRVELSFEGFRLNDLKRWKKLDYMYNGTNPDIRFGAYIRYADFPNISKTDVLFETSGATEGFILTNRGLQRQAPRPKNYINPVPKDQIQLYLTNGYTLTQTKEWQGEQ